MCVGARGLIHFGGCCYVGYWPWLMERLKGKMEEKLEFIWLVAHGRWCEILPERYRLRSNLTFFAYGRCSLSI